MVDVTDRSRFCESLQMPGEEASGLVGVVDSPALAQVAGALAALRAALEEHQRSR